MKIERLNWDKEKHGLVWKITNVFKDYEMDYILKKLPDNKIQIPAEQQTVDKKGFTTSKAAYRATSLPALQGRLESKLKELYPKLRKQYEDEGIELFADELKDFKDISNTKCDISLQGTPQGMDYKIHPDVSSKLLTMLVYISPEASEPTYFHAYQGYTIKYREEDKQPIMAVPWQINTGYIFLANDRSQHSYANDKFNTDRYVVLANLIHEV